MGPLRIDPCCAQRPPSLRAGGTRADASVWALRPERKSRQLRGVRPPHTPAHGCPCVPPSTASWPGPGARRTGLCSEPRAPWGATLAPSVTSYLFPTPTQKSSLRGMLTSSLETRRSWVCTGLERHHRGHSSPLPSEPLEGALWWTRGFLMNSVPKSHGGSGAATPRAWGPGGHLGTGPAPARRTASAGVWSAAGSRGQRPDA